MEEAQQSAQPWPMPAPHWFDTGLHWVTLGIEGIGILVIVLGSIESIALFALTVLRGQNRHEAYQKLRIRLARAILLGLEFLVAADIIGTVAVEPTLENLAALGLIVLIRTFLSFALEVEIEGRWPWRQGR